MTQGEKLKAAITTMHLVIEALDVDSRYKAPYTDTAINLLKVTLQVLEGFNTDIRR